MAVGIGPFAHESIVVSSTAVGFTLTNRGGAQAAYVTTQSQELRYTVDGTTPTSTDGHAAAATSTFWVFGREAIRDFRAIRTGGSDATIKVTYYRDIIP